MKKSKNYGETLFSEAALREALEVFCEQMGEQRDKWKEKSLDRMCVAVNGEQWDHASYEEFFADYRKLISKVRERKGSGEIFMEIRRVEKNTQGKCSMDIHGRMRMMTVGVEFPERAMIEAVFAVFESHAESCRLPSPPQPPPPKIFIAHGRDAAWRDLKDHLSDKHGMKVEAYESGARAGRVIRDTLEGMLQNNSFAVLVMTGDDKAEDGSPRARQNVIHEAGLFQGKLGFNRAIVLLEEGVEGFSNLQGIEQIRFANGNIQSTFGEVLATIRREFPDSK